MATDDRFSMTTEKYLAKHHVLVYLEDAVAQLLEHREENSKINPVKFLCEYFNSVRDGNHTMFREYQYVHATQHNRASFVRLFWKCYRQIGKKGDLLSIQEYHALLSLICADFPFEPVQKTAKIILLDDALDCLISFSDFIYAFQVQFYFEEFIEKCHEVYQSLVQTQRSPRDPVVVPSGSEDTRVHQNNHHPADGVDAMQYFRAIYPICDRSTFSTPPVSALKEILFNVPRVSFYGFLMAISKSEYINEYIGRLPAKAELLEGADSELTSQEAAIQNHARLDKDIVLNFGMLLRCKQSMNFVLVDYFLMDISYPIMQNFYTISDIIIELLLLHAYEGKYQVWTYLKNLGPTIRVNTTKPKARPVSASGNTDSSQNVYPTQRPPSASNRKTPPTRSGVVNNSLKSKSSNHKKDSTDESSSDDTDDSSDT